jgi:hypothetical protein
LLTIIGGSTPKRKIRDQQKRPISPTSLHRSQILRDLRAMQAQAAEYSGYAGPILLLF